MITYINVTIDMNGNFLNAGSSVQDGKLVSVLNGSVSLIYSAGDYSDYADFDNSALFEAYLRQMKECCGSDKAPAYINVLYKYLCKGSLMEDLVSNGILKYCQEAVYVRFYIKTDSIAEK